MHMPVRDWFEQRSFHHQDFSDLASSGEAMRRPAILPHYPMVLHRGGYPDGS